MEYFNFEMICKKTDFYHVVQPIVDLKTCTICGFEFLLRSHYCNDPKMIFQYANIQNQLFEMDIKSIFKIFHLIEKNSETLKGFSLFINLFPSTLMDPAFVYSLQKLMKISGMEPKNIILEISEIEKNIDFYELSKQAENLRALGYLIALDDIGKGEGTLKSILEIEPDIVKIDRYFSQNLTESPKKQNVIRHLIGILNGESEVVLEGLENNADVETAKKLGILYGQGNYLGKPQLPEKYLEEKQSKNRMV